jgi:hypothetical protein
LEGVARCCCWGWGVFGEKNMALLVLALDNGNRVTKARMGYSAANRLPLGGFPFPSRYIAHLAETRFGFCTSAFLPKPPRTPNELGFGGFRPPKLRRDTPFGLKTSASWRNGISDCRTFVPLTFGLTDFWFFGCHIFRHFKSRPMPPELPG